MLSNRRWQILGLIAMALVGTAFGVWLVRMDFATLGAFWMGVFLWRARQFTVWLIAPVKAPSDAAPPLTSKWQRFLLFTVCFLAAAICGVGVYLSKMWPEQWQAGLVFVLFGLLVLAPVTIEEIRSRRKALA